MADDYLTSYEIVILVEATANLVSHWDLIKKLYITPAIQHFHKQLASSNDFLCNAPGNHYGLVLFHAADKTPDSLTECLAPCREMYAYMQMLDSIRFIGGGGEHYSYIAEGLATTLQLFQDMESSRRGSVVERFCFLVCNSPPYHQTSIDSLNYSGFNAKQLAEKLKEVDVKLSVICPRHINELQQIYLSARSPQTTLMNYGQDRRHLVLISGFNLPTEKEPVPLSESTSDEKASLDTMLSDPSVPMDVTPSVPEIPATTTAISSENVSITSAQPISFTTSKTQIASILVSNLAPSNNASSLVPQNIIASNSSSSVASQNNLSVAPTAPVQTTFNSVPNDPSSVNGSSTTGSSLFPSTIIKPNVVSSQGINTQASNNLLQSVRMPTPQPSHKTATPATFQAAKEEADKVVKMLNSQVSTVDGGLKPIWSGIVEWSDKRHASNAMPKFLSVKCQILQSPNSSFPDINTTNWASKVAMQLLPQVFTSHSAVQPHLKSLRQVMLRFSPQDSQQIINVFKSRNVHGLIQFNLPAPESKVIIIFFLRKRDDKTFFIGLLPNDPNGFFIAIKNVFATMQSKKRVEGAMASQSHDPSTSGNMQQHMMQSNISSSSTGMQPNNNLMKDQNLNMPQYRTQVQPQQQQQFQTRPFQNQDAGMSSNQPQMGQVNVTSLTKINMPMSSSMSTHLTIQPTGSNIMRDRMSDGGKIIGGIRNIPGGGNSMQINNISSGQVSLTGGQSAMPSGQRGIPRSVIGSATTISGGNRQGSVRMQQTRPIPMQGNLPGSHESLRTLLNSTNNPMQSSTLNIRQPNNHSLRPAGSNNNNMQSQNYLRGNNMMPGMPNQRPF